MPAVAAIGASLAAGASAVGTAALGVFEGLTLASVATGANILGTGMSLIGMATGNKTLSSIGQGFSMAGGVGSIGNMLKGGLSAEAGISGSNATKTGLLNSDNIDTMLGAQTKGVKSTADLINNSVGDISNNINAPKVGAAAVNGGVGETQSALNQINGTLTKYSMPLGILGGMGEAYMTKQMIDQRDRMQKRDLQMEQNAVNRRSQVPAAGYNINPGNTFNPAAYGGLLRAY